MSTNKQDRKMDRREFITVSSGVLAGLTVVGARGQALAKPVPVRVQKNWASFFRDQGVTGTIAVLDQRDTEALMVHDQVRAEQRFVPASTFKVPHALFALDAGVVKNEFQIFKWDGQVRMVKAWNRDQNLRSSMRHSALWVYQEWARTIGKAREQAYLEAIDYGNANPGGGVDRFWLDGDLRISAVEQISFLQRLYSNELPFLKSHQRLVKDVMIVQAGGDWILRAKTGWSIRTDPNIGWWVGWVERPNGPVFFALNIDMPNGRKDAPKRISIAKAILNNMGALPKSSLR